jgi:hypothetical protein
VVALMWIWIMLLAVLTLGIIAVACSIFTRRTEDLFVESHKVARPYDGNTRH